MLQQCKKCAGCLYYIDLSCHLVGIFVILVLFTHIQQGVQVLILEDTVQEVHVLLTAVRQCMNLL